MRIPGPVRRRRNLRHLDFRVVDEVTSPSRLDFRVVDEVTSPSRLDFRVVDEVTSPSRPAIRRGLVTSSTTLDPKS